MLDDSTLTSNALHTHTHTHTPTHKHTPTRLLTSLHSRMYARIHNHAHSFTYMQISYVCPCSRSCPSLQVHANLGRLSNEMHAHVCTKIPRERNMQATTATAAATAWDWVFNTSHTAIKCGDTRWFKISEMKCKDEHE
jgi:hypothetical protein